MLTDAQVDHFRTFGFLVLPGYLDERETAALADELDRSHRDAFGARYDDHWLAPDPAQPERAALSERMRALGMFQVVEDG
jgi:hypothetical protein